MPVIAIDWDVFSIIEYVIMHFTLCPVNPTSLMGIVNVTILVKLFISALTPLTLRLFSILYMTYFYS